VLVDLRQEIKNNQGNSIQLGLFFGFLRASLSSSRFCSWLLTCSKAIDIHVVIERCVTVELKWVGQDCMAQLVLLVLVDLQQDVQTVEKWLDGTLQVEPSGVSCAPAWRSRFCLCLSTCSEAIEG
jgi:hypothetical protein